MGGSAVLIVPALQRSPSRITASCGLFAMARATSSADHTAPFTEAPSESSLAVGDKIMVKDDTQHVRRITTDGRVTGFSS